MHESDDYSPMAATLTETHRLTRDDTQEGQQQREPYTTDAANMTDAPGLLSPSAPTEDSVEDLAERILQHNGKTLSGEPILTAPELRVIGRAVSLSLTRQKNGEKVKHYYTGVVSAVAAETVTLMHVNRYSETDFATYKERERGLSGRHSTRAVEMKGRLSAAIGETDGLEGDGAAAPAGLVAHGYSMEGAVGVGQRGELTGTVDCGPLLEMEADGSLARAVAAPVEVEAENTLFLESSDALNPLSDTTSVAVVVPNSTPAVEDAPATGRRLPSSQESPIGPLPYVTFLRSSIHEVMYGRDPRSAFYCLFQGHRDEVTDMQFLRMLVRRYLVHTGTDNNPEQVPLYAYVTTRGGCPQLDRAFVYDLVREELPELIKADRAVQKERTRQRRRIARQHQRGSESGFARLFSPTGPLYATNIPHASFGVGVVMFFLALLSVVYMGTMLGFSGGSLSTGFMLPSVWYVIGSAAGWLIASALTVMHAMYMRVDLRKNTPVLLGRLITSLAGAGCAAMCIAVLTPRVSSDSGMYTYLQTRPGEELCDFYQRNACSGFYTTCGPLLTSDRTLCDVPCSLYYYSETTCYSALWNPVQVLLIPLIIVSALMLLGCISSLMLTLYVIVFSCRFTRPSA